MSNRPIKENAFDGAPGGAAGAISYQAPYGTPASPDVQQNPGAFDSNNRNKAANQPQKGVVQKDLDQLYADPRTAPTPDEVIAGLKYEMGQQIKKDKGGAKRTVLANLKKDPKFYSSLKQLNITDKDMMDNMTENTHPNSGIDIQVYNKLQEMKTFKVGDYIGLRLMREQLTNSLIRLANSGKIFFDGTTATSKPLNESRHPNDSPERPKVTPNIEETKKIFTEMSKGRDKKYVVNSQICDVMKEMWAARTPEVRGELGDNMKVMIDGKEYEACITSPYENPNNPKYVLVNGYMTPVDTIGPHRPLPVEESTEKSKDGMYDLAIVNRNTKAIKTKPIVPKLISIRYNQK